MKSENFIPADEWMQLYLEKIQAGQKLRISPIGYSMVPLLTGKKDEVVLGRIDTPLRSGDICLFRRDSGTYVLHTLHHIDHAGGYYFIGDSQTQIEGPLRREQVIARADSYIRKGREHSCSAAGFRVMHQIWLKLRIIRPFLLRIYGIYQKLKKSIR